MLTELRARRISLTHMDREEMVRRWIQIALVFGVLIVAPAIAFFVRGRMALAVIGLPVAFVGLFILLKWPQLGFIMLTTLGMLSLSTLPVLDFAATLYIALTGLWLVRMIAFERQLKFVSAPSVTAVLYFSIVVILAFTIGQFPWFPVAGAPMETQIAGVLIYLCSFLAFLLVANLVRDIRWLKWMVYSFLVVAGVFAALSLLPFGRQFIRTYYSLRATGGSLFWVWTTVLSLSMAFFNRKLPIWSRILCVLIGAILLYFGLILNRQWVSGWVPPVVAIMGLVWFGAPRLAFPLSAVASIGIASQWNIIYNLVVGENEYSTISRLDAWKVMGEIIMANPLLGVGPSNYYFYTPLFNILGFYVEFNSHNNYFDLLAQTGILGLICFFWVMWTIGVLGVRLLKKVPKYGFAHAFVAACMGGLVASIMAGMLGDWVIPFYYNIGIEGLRASGLSWMFWGGLVAIDQLLKVNKPVD